MNRPRNSIQLRILLLMGGGLSIFITLLALFGAPVNPVYAQQPTGSIPTVTGTLTGPMVTVYSDQSYVDVYAGPSSYNYEPVGIMVSGEKAVAMGYSQDGNWIEIVYYGTPGNTAWIYAPFVSISPGSLPKLPAPPTAIPRTTPTLNPTSVEAFGVNLEPTRLPTYTPPAPLKLPTFAPAMSSGTRIPFGFVILLLALIGILGAVISFLRGNR